MGGWTAAGTGVKPKVFILIRDLLTNDSGQREQVVGYSFSL